MTTPTQHKIPSRKNTQRKTAPAKIDFTPLALGLFMMLIWGMILFLTGIIVAHAFPQVADGAFIVAWTGVGTSTIAFALLPLTRLNA